MNGGQGVSRRAVLTGAVAGGVAAAVPLRYARAASVVKVGVILPTSGVLSFPGLAALRGIQFGEKILREKGGQEFKFIHFDTESKPENGRVAVEKLVGEGCSVLIGAWDSGTTISAAQGAEAAKVPLIVNIASAPQITELGFSQVFRNFTPSGVLVRNAVARIKEVTAGRSVTPKTAVILNVNDTFGQAVLGAVNGMWRQLDVPIEIIGQIGYDVRAKDLSVEVGRAKAMKPDLLLPITRVSDAVMIVREMVKQDFSPMGVISPGSPGPYERAFTNATGKYGNEIMVSVPWYDPRNPRTRALVARYSKEHPEDRFELNVGFSYEATEILADAVARAGSGDPAAIHAALKATNITDHVMYGGPIQFDEKGQNHNIGCALLQVQAGEPRVVGPQEVAETSAVFPMTPFDKR